MRPCAAVPALLRQVFTEVEISFYLLRRLLGVKTQEGGKQVPRYRAVPTGAEVLCV